MLSRHIGGHRTFLNPFQMVQERLAGRGVRRSWFLRVGEQRCFKKKVSATARAPIFLKQQAGPLELVFWVDQPTEFLVSEVRIEVFVYGGVSHFFLNIYL